MQQAGRVPQLGGISLSFADLRARPACWCRPVSWPAPPSARAVDFLVSAIRVRDKAQKHRRRFNLTADGRSTPDHLQQLHLGGHNVG
jgi:hypothetical protein